MNKQKIERIERQIRKLHYNPEKSKLGFSDKEAKKFTGLFWDIHVKPVIEYCMNMADKYKADKEVVWLAAILHDIARLDEMEPHDEVGSHKAMRILKSEGFPKDVIKQVGEAILTHRCKRHLPESLEQKVLASADAMAHFIPPFYLWIAKYSNKTFTEDMAKNLAKLERDYGQKIFFKEEKAMVNEHYRVLKDWFNFKLS